MNRHLFLMLLQTLLATTALAQVPDEDFEDTYDEVLANLDKVQGEVYK